MRTAMPNTEKPEKPGTKKQPREASPDTVPRLGAGLESPRSNHC
jgi:hypothetical protein